MQRMNLPWPSGAEGGRAKLGEMAGESFGIPDAAGPHLIVTRLKLHLMKITENGGMWPWHVNGSAADAPGGYRFAGNAPILKNVDFVPRWRRNLLRCNHAPAQ